MTTKNNWISLTPLALFVAVYLGLSLYLDDFYKVPVTVAFMASCVYGVLISRGMGLGKRVGIFSAGAGDRNLLMMVWIFVLAGAFANSAQGMGAVDATVELALWLLPSSFIIPGLFLAACFISISVGTSVGTIVALTPVAVGIAGQIGASVPMVAAVVVGGTFFGDNLSFISDTTVVATKTQGCEMRDKFRANVRIVLPAAALMLAICFFMGSGTSAPEPSGDIQYIKVLPYVAVLVAALMGVDVMAVLVGGIALTAAVGLATSSYDLPGLMQSMGDGITGMGELIIVTLLAGGMLGLIRHNGGLDYLTRTLTSRVKSKRGAELCIGLLVTFTDICTANNTIAILTTGPVAKDIAEKYGISPQRSASLLDTFSCFAQGLIPYGAQLLMASALASVTPIDIIKHLYYPLILGVVALVFIIVSRND